MSFVLGTVAVMVVIEDVIVIGCGFEETVVNVFEVENGLVGVQDASVDHVEDVSDGPVWPESVGNKMLRDVVNAITINTRANPTSQNILFL